MQLQQNLFKTNRKQIKATPYFSLCCDEVVQRGIQGAKDVSFTACHLGKLWLAYTSLQVISAGPYTLFD